MHQNHRREHCHADLAVAVAIAPFGLRGLAVNTDGTKLYVAAPNVLWQGLTPWLPVGHILVIDLTPKANGTPKWTPLPPINAGRYPYGVTAGPNDSITFTDFLFKNQSLGLIQPGSNTATFSPFIFQGNLNDEFEVNNAVRSPLLRMANTLLSLATTSPTKRSRAKIRAFRRSTRPEATSASLPTRSG